MALDGYFCIIFNDTQPQSVTCVKALLIRSGVAALLCLSFAARAQVVLRLDFNDRSSSLPTNNLAGFDPFMPGAARSLRMKCAW